MTEYARAIEGALLEGEALVKAGRFEEGEQRAQSVLGAQPRNPAAHYILAFSSIMQQRHAEGLQHIQNALRSDRVNAQYHFMAGLCFSAMARLEDATASYRRAVQLRPEFFEARANLGYLLECDGKLSEAVDCYRKVLEQNPYEFYSLSRMGYCERIMGHPGEAIGFLQRALQLNPKFAPTINEVALCLMQLERKEEAIDVFRKAVEHDPQFVSAWANLGKIIYLDYVVASGEGRADAAPVLEVFDRILALDPQNSEFRYLRDCVSGARVDQPPPEFIQSFFDRFSEKYDTKLVDELKYEGPRVASELLAPWLADKKGLSVVDLGCGTGLSGAVVRDHAARLVGVDLSGGMLHQARLRGNYDELIHGDIVEFLDQQAAGSVDLLLALEVFIYSGDLKRSLAACARALRPGGLLAFSVEEADAAVKDFHLAPSGRYTHSLGYVGELARSAGLKEHGAVEATMRREANQPVKARLFAFTKG